MLCALSYLVMVIGRFPIIPAVAFLKYDPKDVIVTIAGFIYGPLSALAVSFIVSFIEMITVSDTGWIGLLMNVLSTASFACIAALVYRKLHNAKGAVIGLVCGIITMTGVMLAWNYFITPMYMGVPREQIKELLLPAFLPFNLIKSVLNAAITMMIYKPVVTALRRASLIPPSQGGGKREHKFGLLIVSLLVAASCVVLIIALNNK